MQEEEPVSFSAEEDFRPREKEFPFGQAPEDSGLRMVIRRAALAKVISHCEEECRGEQCGVLVGEPYLDDTGLYLEIDDAIEGRFSDSRHRRVTFTHTTWQYIQKRIDK